VCGRWPEEKRSRAGALSLLAALLFAAAACTGRSEQDGHGAKQEEERTVALRIVYDNYPDHPDLQTDWGFACVVQGFEKTILFDTGANGEILLSNMKAVDVSPEDVDVVVLSHVHGDHTGGLETFLGRKSGVEVFMPASFPERIKARARETGARVVAVDEPVTICEGVHSTGEMGEQIKEQALVLRTSEGLAVITGCAHPGIVEMVKRATELGPEPVHLVMGGYHLLHEPSQTIRSVIAMFREIGVRNVAPCHCSGDETRRMMKEAFGKGYLPAGAGTALVLHRQGEQGE